MSDDDRMSYAQYPKCPFYISASGLTKRTKLITVTCECHVENLGFDVRPMLRFRNRADRRDFMELFCNDRWKECPWAKRIAEKYREML